MKIAGYATQHLGVGRCKYHGGSSPSKHGRYATVVKAGPLAVEMRRLGTEGDPLNPMPELLLMRALVARFIDVNQDMLSDPAYTVDAEGNAGPAIDALETAIKLIDQIGRSIGRIERVRAISALSLPELQELVRKMAGVVERVVQDPYKLKAIGEEWRILIGGATSGGSAVGQAARAAFAAGEEPGE